MVALSELILGIHDYTSRCENFFYETSLFNPDHVQSAGSIHSVIEPEVLLTSENGLLSLGQSR